MQAAGNRSQRFGWSCVGLALAKGAGGPHRRGTTHAAESEGGEPLTRATWRGHGAARSQQRSG